MRLFFFVYGLLFKFNFIYIYFINIVDIYFLMCEILSVEVVLNNGILSEVKEFLIILIVEKFFLSNLKEKFFETIGIICKLLYKIYV